MIQDLITRMDDSTTLIVFGDHGMTEDGNHGGGSELELRTVMFAYQKSPFPLQAIYNENQEAFTQLDHSLKLSDLPSIVSVILDVPQPFSNLGVFHPIFANTNNVNRAHEMFLDNIIQIRDYLKEYCQVTS